MRVRAATIDKFEFGFIVLTLLMSTESFMLFVPQALRQIFWLGAYGVTALLVLRRWQAFIDVASRAKMLWFLIGIVLLSIVWSDAPSVSVRQSIAIMGTTLIGIHIATRYSFKMQLQLLAWVFGIAAVLSLILAVAFPSYGLQGGMAWQGIYHHKNLLGRNMLLGAMVFLLNSMNSKSYRWFYWGCLALSVALLLLSDSKTSLILFVIALAFLPVYQILRLYYKLAVPLLSIALLIGGSVFFAIVIHAESILGAMGKDLTFTGRTELWSLVMPKIQDRFWLGYGYGGFWRGWSGESADIWFFEPWFPTHAHNGYLDLLLEIGFVGIIIFGVGALLVLYRTTLWVSVTRSSEYLFPLTFLIILLLYNMTETAWLTHNTLSWILYVTIVCMRLEPSAYLYREKYMDERLIQPPYATSTSYYR